MLYAVFVSSFSVAGWTNADGLHALPVVHPRGLLPGRAPSRWMLPSDQASRRAELSCTSPLYADDVVIVPALTSTSAICPMLLERNPPWISFLHTFSSLLEPTPSKVKTVRLFLQEVASLTRWKTELGIGLANLPCPFNPSASPWSRPSLLSPSRSSYSSPPHFIPPFKANPW